MKIKTCSLLRATVLRLVCATAAALLPVTKAQPTTAIFYKYQVVAKTGDHDHAGRTFVSFGRWVSINDAGTVAFQGSVQDAGGGIRQNVFTSPVGAPPAQPVLSTSPAYELLQPPAVPGQEFTGPQINNFDEVLVWRHLDATVVYLLDGSNMTAPMTYQELWGANATGMPLRLICSGNGGVSGAEWLFFMFKNPATGHLLPSAFDPNSPWVHAMGRRNEAFGSLNNAGQVAYCAFDGSKYYLASETAASPASGAIQLTGNPRRVKLADNGTILAHLEQSGFQEIALFSFDLKTKVTVASTANGFSSLGQSPNISDDGHVTVFCGNLGNPVALPATYPPTANMQSGPGLFAAVDDGAGHRILLRLAGARADLGYDNSFQPIGFATIDANAWSSVCRVSLGPPGLDGDDLVVSFIATPAAQSPASLFTGAKGIWTVRGTLSQQGVIIDYRRTGLMPAVQVGDQIEGDAINDVALYDSVAIVAQEEGGLTTRSSRHGEHRLAFWASTPSGDRIVRATYLDSDEDCLPDHWEQNGVTVAGILVDLPAMGADAFHKDLFIHADWMEPTATYAFNHRALRFVSDAFRDAPVANPDGQSGIHLHVDAGQRSLMDPVRRTAWGALSKAGTMSYQPLIGSFAAGAYVWHDVDAVKRLHYVPAGRSGIFHYALFAHAYTSPPRSGRSREIPGSDFLLTLGQMPLPDGTPKAGGTVNQQAGTFMHELGHNLGLRHGGSGDEENKPNYLSIMNYRFQFTGLLVSGSHGIEDLISGLREWNYSTRKLPDLDENNLREAVGISDPDHHFTLWSGPCDSTVDYFQALPYPAVDWDCDGALTPGAVSIDLNAHGKAVLAGFNDWPAVVFDGGAGIGGAGAAGVGLDSTNTAVDEPMIAELMALIPPGLEDDEAIAPVDEVEYSPDSGLTPLTVAFDGTASADPVGTIASWVWDFGDGSTNSGPAVVHTYVTPGVYFATLNVQNDKGLWNRSSVRNRVVVAAPFSLSAKQVDPGRVEIALIGQADVTYRLESSGDLSDWAHVAFLSSTNGATRFTNGVSGTVWRFYRASLP